MVHNIGRFNPRLLALITLGALSAGTYLQLSEFSGFPLDDAWIHQTYARNLISDGKWAFFMGEASGGSTAPLWTLLLTPAYMLGIDHRAWSHLLGMAQLVLIAWVGAKWVSHRLQKSLHSLWPLGLIFLFEWHLVWAALSGMETISLSLLAMLVLYWLDTGRNVPTLVVGAVIGAGGWLRPDALILIAPAVWFLYWDKGGIRRKTVGTLILGTMLAFVPYLLFNLALSGEVWPNTLFAKQAEYAGLRAAPFWFRLGRMLGLPLNLQGTIVTEAGGPLIGISALLLPGVVLDFVRVLREQKWQLLSPYLWMAGLLLAYAWRLPATYQHGRYSIPVVPIFVSLGLIGTWRWIERPSQNLVRRVAQRTWGLSAILLLVIFWLRGGVAYAQDVTLIQTEMVAAAEWIDQNTGTDALVAAHDIGALGYFAQREILDLAGLISPEVVEFIRDESRLMSYIRNNNADFLVTFPSFYSSSFTYSLEVVFRSNSEIMRRFGGEPMTVYRLDS
jgi:hypothetical protein